MQMYLSGYLQDIQSEPVKVLSKINKILDEEDNRHTFRRALSSYQVSLVFFSGE